MFRPLVYLFELDSVRITNDEIVYARHKLYDAVVNEGQCVVLSFNQLTDSSAFLSPIAYRKYEFLMDFYMDLFKTGALKVSHFYSPVDKCIIRTPAQYIINSLEKAISSVEKKPTYIFSSLPIQKDNIAALTVVLDAFKYCDLELLESIPDVQIADRAYIQRYVKWMLDLSLLDLSGEESVEESVYVTCKQSDYLKFSDYVDALLVGPNSAAFAESLSEDLRNAWRILIDVNSSFIGNRYSRSDWLKNIDRESPHLISTSRLAKEMVHLCYNFGVESSIEGITTPYCTDINAFMIEFRKRISAISDSLDAPQSTTVVEWMEFPDWEHAAHIARAAHNVLQKSSPETLIGQSAWQRICRKGQLRKLLGACILYLSFLIIDFLTGLPELVNNTLSLTGITIPGVVKAVWNSVWDSFFPSVFSVTIVSWISSKTTDRLSIPDITEIFQTIKEVCTDMYKLQRKGERR